MRNTFFAIGAAWAISAAGLALADERGTATGKVTDAAGKPVEHATVLVYEAHVKRGYSVYCPTCWVDCGKHAFTDAEGAFTIAGLNSDLLFKLLVVKDGYSAVFSTKWTLSRGRRRPPHLSHERQSKMFYRLCADGWSIAGATR